MGLQRVRHDWVTFTSLTFTQQRGNSSSERPFRTWVFFYFAFYFIFIYFSLFFILPFRTWDYWPGCWPGIEFSFRVVLLQQIILLPTVWNFLPPSLPLEIPFLLHGPSQKISHSKNPLFIPSLMSLFEPLHTWRLCCGKLIDSETRKIILIILCLIS